VQVLHSPQRRGLVERGVLHGRPCRARRAGVLPRRRCGLEQQALAGWWSRGGDGGRDAMCDRPRLARTRPCQTPARSRPCARAMASVGLSALVPLRAVVWDVRGQGLGGGGGGRAARARPASAGAPPARRICRDPHRSETCRTRISGGDHKLHAPLGEEEAAVRVRGLVLPPVANWTATTTTTVSTMTADSVAALDFRGDGTCTCRVRCLRQRPTARAVGSLGWCRAGEAVERGRLRWSARSAKATLLKSHPQGRWRMLLLSRPPACG
jgi:hypothetical protein